MSQKQLQGKVALITGAGSGLGEASAWALGRAGCAVACLDIDRAAAERVGRNLAENDIDSQALRCDVRNADHIIAAVDEIVDTFGRLDIIVNSAAVDHTLSVEELTIEQWDQVIDVNLRGPFILAKAAWPHLRRQGGGHIFNIASTAAVRAWANTSAYHASKWGLIGLSRGLGVEGRADNIKVTTVIPGGMQTHFFDRFIEQGIPMPDPANLQDPANVAGLIVVAAALPAESVLQELIVTPLNEPSWP